MTALTNKHAFIVGWRDLNRWILPKRLLFSFQLPDGWTLTRVGDLIEKITFQEPVIPDEMYKMAGVRWYGEGVFHRETVLGEKTSASYLAPIVPGAFIYNRLFAWKESFAVVPSDFTDYYVSREFPQFSVDENRLLPDYLYLFFLTKEIIKVVFSRSVGSAAVSRNRFKEDEFLEFEIPLPPPDVQAAIVTQWQAAQQQIETIHQRLPDMQSSLLNKARIILGTKLENPPVQPRFFSLMWQDIDRWGVEISWKRLTQPFRSAYPLARIKDICEISSGGTPSRKKRGYFGGNIPWVKTAEVINSEIIETEESITEKGLKNSSARIYPKGSILIAMYGQGITRGRTAKLGIEAATNQACAALTEFRNGIQPDFVWYYLMTEYERLRDLASGNNQPNLNLGMIADFPIPIPPKDIQDSIIKKMELGTSAIRQEQELAIQVAADIEAELEALIFGKRSPL